MSAARVEQILRQIEVLSPDERWQVHEALARLLRNTDTQLLEAILACRLAELGLVSEILPTPDDVERYERYRPIKVRGEPVSQTLIEERR